jgi:hypothetical protein
VLGGLVGVMTTHSHEVLFHQQWRRPHSPCAHNQQPTQSQCGLSITRAPLSTISQQLLHFDGTFLHNVLGESAAMMMAMFGGIKCIIIWTPDAPSSNLLQQLTPLFPNDSELCSG